MNGIFLTDLAKRQENYSLAPSCSGIIKVTSDNKQFVLSTPTGKYENIIPIGTSRHEAQQVAKVLQGTIEEKPVTVTFAVPAVASDEFRSGAFSSAVPGIVVGTEIFMLFNREDSKQPNNVAHETMYKVAQAINGRVENIVVFAKAEVIEDAV